MSDVTPERWAWIPGFEGRYQVSDLGHVLSFAKSQPRLLAGRLHRGHHTYRRVWFQGREFMVHVLVMLAFAGPCPDGHEVCHKNGDGLDNRLDNLYYGTPSQNTRDAIRHGTHFNARKTVCPRCGGEYDIVSSSGRTYRRCLACTSRLRRARRVAV
jgi:hypothetical protein